MKAENPPKSKSLATLKRVVVSGVVGMEVLLEGFKNTLSGRIAVSEYKQCFKGHQLGREKWGSS